MQILYEFCLCKEGRGITMILFTKQDQFCIANALCYNFEVFIVIWRR
jgi:hypothetical protein